MLGGGMTMVKLFRKSGSLWKYPFPSQSLYHLSSTSPGLYFVGSSRVMGYLFGVPVSVRTFCDFSSSLNSLYSILSTRA